MYYVVHLLITLLLLFSRHNPLIDMSLLLASHLPVWPVATAFMSFTDVGTYSKRGIRNLAV